MTAHRSEEVTVGPVRNARDRRAFRRLPYRLYADDPHWVAPLNLDVRKLMNPRRHPFYENGDIDFFLARRGREVVGRIGAIENRAHNRHHGDRTGFFGFFETIDDPAVSHALLEQAATWARDRDLDSVRGPTSPSLNYETGLLVSGKTGPPVLMMPHNPPWYAGHIEAAGFDKVMDLHAFWLDRSTYDFDRWNRLARRVLDRNAVTLRSVDMSRFQEDVELIVELFNDAWSENWGFVPLSPREIAAMAQELRPVIVPRLCTFLVRDGREIGFWLGLLDYNQILLHLKGRLFPFGILRLLRAKKQLKYARVILMGIRKEHQNLGLDVALYGDIVTGTKEMGVHAAESSWVLETNRPMANTLTRVGGNVYRTYRLYERSL